MSTDITTYPEWISSSEEGAWDAYVETVGDHYADADDEEAFRDAHQGEYESMKAFAEHLIDHLGYLDELPEMFRSYFDYEAYARDLETEYTLTNGHVFQS